MFELTPSLKTYGPSMVTFKSKTNFPNPIVMRMSMQPAYSLMVIIPFHYEHTMNAIYMSST
jgi:hypothetical protein